GSRPAPGLERAPVDCCSSCAFRLGVPSGWVELPQWAQPADLASRFVAPPESGQPVEFGLRLSPVAEQPWNYRLPSEHEKRLRSQPPESVQPRPGSNRSLAAAERWRFDGLPSPRFPAAGFLVSLLASGRS